MTFEHKCMIETADIVGIHYECGHCHAATVIPIEKINPDQVATLATIPCSFCNTATGLNQNSQEMRSFLTFNVALQTIASHMAGRNLKMRLEIKCPE